MSNVAKLKKRALEYEQKKQFDKALETYVQILGALDDHIDEADVALYNRVGDLMLRQGDVSAAVDHYEHAVDLYSDGGFFNNAIALCNKILRNAPGRTSVYYKLGKISAKKGFINDAKQNFLEYADRMQRVGELEEAFRALKEFADLCPDQDDIRLMLADQLVRKDRKGEAVEQLQVLFEKFQAEGRTSEARATVDRMKAIDPTLEPKESVGRPISKANDLIFLDVNYDEPAGSHARSAGGSAAAPSSPPPPPAAPPPAVAPAPAPPAAELPDLGEAVPTIDLPLLDIDLDSPTADAAPADARGGAGGAQEPGGREIVSHVDSGFITGFEQTSLDTSLAEDVAPLAELEIGGDGLDSGMLIDDQIDVSSLDIVPSVFDGPPAASADLSAEGVGTDGGVGGDLVLIYPDDAASAPESAFGEGVDAASGLDGGLGRSPSGGELDATLDGDLDDVGSPTLDLIYSPEPDLGDATAAGSVSRAGAGRAEHRAAKPIARVVDRLQERVDQAPQDYDLRRQLGEALLEDGDREGGLAELEAAMLGFEQSGDLRGASAVAEELILVEPGAAHFHQKRVEYAVRSNDKGRLADAYLALAECLFRAGQFDKSRAVYGRVLELAPDDARAHSALSAFDDVPAEEEHLAPLRGDAPPKAGSTRTPAVGSRTSESPSHAPSRAGRGGIGVGAERASAAPPPPSTPGRSGTRNAPPPPPSPEPRVAASKSAAPEVTPPAGDPLPDDDDDFVNLSDWLREDASAKNTRMVVDVNEPRDQAEVDFAEMLSMFKQGVAANVEDADHESHYDLGVAYKEMGLLDEAISEFQKALRGTEQRVRTYEALGQCFVEKRQYQIALTILGRALHDKSYTDDMLVGVLYLLGYASEALARWDEALRFYERVFAVDIQFRDIGDRMAAVERQAG